MLGPSPPGLTWSPLELPFSFFCHLLLYCLTTARRPFSYAFSFFCLRVFCDFRSIPHLIELEAIAGPFVDLELPSRCCLNPVWLDFFCSGSIFPRLHLFVSAPRTSFPLFLFHVLSALDCLLLLRFSHLFLSKKRSRSIESFRLTSIFTTRAKKPSKTKSKNVDSCSRHSA